MKKQSKRGLGILILVLIVLFLLSSVTFLVLPASIFSESSDLTHDERDQEIVRQVENNNLGFTTTSEGLVKTISIYKNAFGALLTTTPTFDYSVNQTEATSGRITEEEFDLICSITEAEGGDSYESALAVISCVSNRIRKGGFDSSWEREKHLASTPNSSDPLSVLTANGQFEAYINYSYLKHTGKVKEDTKKAVRDCLGLGKVSHNYVSFRSYETENSHNIGGNYFFDEIEAGNPPKYDIGDDLTEGDSQGNEVTDETNFINPDPNGEDNWDLLYLISAYDVSKNNLEGKNKLETPVSRYTDLIVNLGEYIIKAIYGVEVRSTKEEVIPVKYPVYSEKEVTVWNGSEFEKVIVFEKTGEEETKIPLTINVYNPVELKILPEDKPDLTGYVLTQDDGKSLLFTNNSGEVVTIPYETSSTYFAKTEQEETITPETVQVEETTRVRGLAKSVLLSVLDLAPGDPYEVLGDIKTITNSDMIEMSRLATIKTLDLKTEDYSVFTGTAAGGYSGGVAGKGTWIWPLDPNGVGAFVITSLMGTRESPGGIGSTDHGGTDIGAAYGTPILAVKDGVVEIAGEFGGYGNCVRINHGILDDGATYQTLYGHMSVIASHVGESVKQGQVIGYVGSTGWSTGPHLHYEVIQNGEKINGLSLYGEDIYSRLTYNL